MKFKLIVFTSCMITSLTVFSNSFTHPRDSGIYQPSWRLKMILEDLARYQQVQDLNLSYQSENEYLRASLMASYESIAACSDRSEQLEMQVVITQNMNDILGDQKEILVKENKKLRFWNGVWKVVTGIVLVVALVGQ